MPDNLANVTHLAKFFVKGRMSVWRCLARLEVFPPFVAVVTLWRQLLHVIFCGSIIFPSSSPSNPKYLQILLLHLPVLSRSGRGANVNVTAAAADILAVALTDMGAAILLHFSSNSSSGWRRRSMKSREIWSSAPNSILGLSRYFRYLDTIEISAKPVS